MKRKCRDCGKVFEVEPGKTQYLCSDCYKRTKSSGVLRERVCKMCGSTFLGYPRSFYCPACSLERRREQSRAHRKSGTARPIGSTDICHACGKPYIVQSGRQRYCKDCAGKIVKETVRAQKRAYMAEHKEESRALKADTRGKRYICPICGKEFERHTPQATCSPGCERELKRIRQNEADIRRGKRKLPAADRRKADLPQSGVPGVSYNRKLKKWQVAYKGRYIGVYTSMGQAVQALEAEEKRNGSPRPEGGSVV